MRNVLGWFEDHRVAANKSGKHFPGRNRKRKIERTYEAGDSDRPPVAHRPFVAQLAWNRMAEQPASFTCRVISGVNSFLDVAARFGERLPHLASHGIGDLVLSFGQEVANHAQNVTARRSRTRTPLRKAALRAINRAIYV